MKYASFLICFHPTHTDVYLSGIPLATIRDGKVTPHTRKNADGTHRPVDVALLEGSPFGSVVELQEAVAGVTARLVGSVSAPQPASESPEVVTSNGIGSFFLFSGQGYYPMGGFADFTSAHGTLDAATQAAEAEFDDPSTEWAEVIDVRTGKRVYGRGGSCYFNFEKTFDA